MRRDTLLTFAQLTAGMVLLGSSAPVGKIVAQGFPPFTASFLRLAIASLTLLPVFLMMRGSRPRLSRRAWICLLGIGALGGVGFNVFLLTGVREVPASLASVVMSTGPAVIAIGSVLFTGDRFTKLKVAGVGLGVGGAMLAQVGASGGGGGNLWLGLALVAAAVVCQAAFTLLGQQVREELSALRSLVIANLLGLPLFVPFLLIERPWTTDLPGDWQAWAALGWWSVAGAALGAVLWYRAVDKVSGSVAGGFSALNPVAGLTLSYMLLGEPVRAVEVAGMTVAVIGILLIARAHRKEARA